MNTIAVLIWQRYQSERIQQKFKHVRKCSNKMKMHQCQKMLKVNACCVRILPHARQLALLNRCHDLYTGQGNKKPLEKEVKRLKFYIL